MPSKAHKVGSSIGFMIGGAFEAFHHTAIVPGVIWLLGDYKRPDNQSDLSYRARLAVTASIFIFAAYRYFSLSYLAVARFRRMYAAGQGQRDGRGGFFSGLHLGLARPHNALALLAAESASSPTGYGAAPS